MLCLESKQLACWDPLQFLKNWVSKIVSKNCFLKKTTWGVYRSVYEICKSFSPTLMTCLQLL
jgi:hypothetical protein